jgi:uncharacterized protein YggE
MRKTLVFGHATLLAGALLLLVTGTAAWAGDANLMPRILVTGEGSVDVAPDMAVLKLTVTREAATASEALDANSAAMKNVLEAMQSQGVEARDLQTSGFSIQPRYSYPPQRSSREQEAPRIVGYTVRNSLSVRVRDIGMVGSILDTSVTLGVNEGGNIIFTNDDPSAAITQARIMAMQDAMARAGTLAEAAGVELGKLLEISEQTRQPRPMAMVTAEMSLSRSADAVPVATGENTYRVTVNVSYAIHEQDG